MQKTFCLSVGRAWRPFVGRSDHHPEIQEKSWRTWEPRTECQRLWPNSAARRLCRWHDCRVWLAKREGAGQSVLSNWGKAVCEIFKCAFKHPCYDSVLEKCPIFSCCKFVPFIILRTFHQNATFRNVVRTIQQFNSYRVRFQSNYFFIFQAHRDEVITMVANPVVDQVISAGLGESKLFVSSITSKILIIKNHMSYLLRAQKNVPCKICAHLPFVCVKSSTIIFTFPFSICGEITGYFHCFSTWRVNMVAWNKPQRNCHCANYTHWQETSQGIHDFFLLSFTMAVIKG